MKLAENTWIIRMISVFSLSTDNFKLFLCSLIASAMVDALNGVFDGFIEDAQLF